MWEKLKILWQLTKGNRLLYGLAVMSIIVAGFATFTMPRVFQVAIDYTLEGKPLADMSLPAPIEDLVDWIGPRTFWARNLWMAGLLAVGLTALGGFFTFLHGYWTSLASERTAKSLRMRLYDHLQHLPCRFHDRSETGDLVQRCTSDVETVRMFLQTQLAEVGRSLTLLAMALGFMLPLSVEMTLISMAVVPLVIGFSVIFFVRVKNRFKITDEAEGRMTAMLQENLSGIRVVRAFAREEFEQDKFARHNTEYRDKWFGLIRLFSLFWPLSDLLCMTQIALVLTAGAWMVQTDPQFTIGDLVAFMLYVKMFLWPVRRMGRVLSDMGKAIVSIGRIHDILDAPAEKPVTNPPPPAQQPDRVRGALEVQNVTFSHDGDGGRHALAGVSFRVQPGETLAIMGPSGSGKSTIVNLLLRLYDFEHGRILLDDMEIRSLDRKYVRSQIGSVLQEPFLYSRSLRDNVRVGRREANDDDIRHAVAMAALEESVTRFEKGYDTPIGERGVTLSGGQRQRVALARVMLKNPPVLVLDDALSAVDTRTEKLILDALNSRGGKHTTLVIAHRISTLMHADRIIVLDHGRVVQEGTHGELIRRDGMYRRLWQIQYELEEDLQGDLQSEASAARDGEAKS